MTQSIPSVEGPLVTQGDIEAGLHNVGVTPGGTVLVHTSLRAFGWVCGGSVAVIEALKAAVGSSGTLVMPSFSADVSDPKHWLNPPVPEDWWPRIRETMPAYDPARSRTTGLGRTPETFRTDPGVMRSAHPKTSFTAWGALADTIMADHKLEGGLGGGSPLQKLYNRNARVLFLGTGFRTCTAFHLGEWRAGKRPMIEDGAPVMVNGDRQWVTYEDMDYDEVPFTDMGADFENHTPSLKPK